MAFTPDKLSDASPPIPPDPNDGASILAMLAAQSGRGFDPNLKPITIPALKIAGTSETQPDSDWYVPGAELGDVIIGKTVVGHSVDAVAYYDRPLWDERKRLPDGSFKPIETWKKEAF
jgi:hypothetical protein